MKIDIHVVRVFVNGEGKFGNPVGIILDEEHRLDDTVRQEMATRLGFNETVFIDILSPPAVSLFNPKHKVRFAGHAVLGTAWFIKHTFGERFDFIRCGETNVAVVKDQERMYLRAPFSIMPEWNFEQLSDVAAVNREGLAGKKHTVVWAWIDEKPGHVRARTFAPDWGIPEDEANGSGSMLLAAKLNRDLKVFHGKGSVIYAHPYGNEAAEVGGDVTQD